MIRKRSTKTVDHNPAGWPLAEYDRGYPGVQKCRSVLSRAAKGILPCAELSVWRVRTSTRGLVATGYFCNQHLPQ